MGSAESRIVVFAMVLIVTAGTSTARAQFQAGLLITGTLEKPQFESEFHLREEQREAARKATAEANRAIQDAGRQVKGLDAAERMKILKELNDKVAADYEKALDAALSGEQMKRLREICLQSMGAMALGSPDLQERLKLTDEQKVKWLDIQKTNLARMRDVMKAPAAERSDRAKAARQELMQAAMGLLTEEQRTVWKTMLGPPSPKIVQ